jgi:uncharacterized protein YjbI with pentapeptide repeats
MATEKQLKERWETPEGNKLKCRITMYIKKPGWEKYLVGFPFVDEIENGRDLRAIDLSNNSRLGRAKLNETNISNANFNNSNLVEAELNNTIAIGSNFYKATLSFAKLNEAILKEAIFIGAVMFGVEMKGADLEGADLTNVLLQDANISNSKFNNEVSLDGADLNGVEAKQTTFNNCELNGANFFMANLTESEFNNSVLTNSIFNGADITKTKIINCNIYGISAWGIKTNENTIIKDLIISENPLITVDDIEIAQFIYLILNNKQISKIITSMRTKVVLILGSFRENEKKTLDLAKEIVLKNSRGYIPMVFDFDPSTLQTLIDTIRVLELLSRFIIIDLTRSAGQLIELGLLDKLQVPYAIIYSDDTEHIPGNIEKYLISEWCYKKDLIPYSCENKEDELKGLINSISLWAEEINTQYEKVIIGNRNRIKSLNEKLPKKNINNKK